MAKPKNLKNHQYGKLTPIQINGKSKDGHITWECKCTCGTLITVQSNELVTGLKQSCGCSLATLIAAKGAFNLTNLKVGRLTVLKEVGKIKNGINAYLRLWNCLCECGKYVNIRSTHLVQGRVKSCGCLASETARQRVSLPPGESGFNALYKRYQDSAKDRDFEFSLSKDEFKNLTKLDCFYCGCKPESLCYAQKRPNFTAYIYNGVDRKNNNEGYTLNNSVACCTQCNYLKHTLDFNSFFIKINQIINYQKLKIEMDFCI